MPGLSFFPCWFFITLQALPERVRQVRRVCQVRQVRRVRQVRLVPERAQERVPQPEPLSSLLLSGSQPLQMKM